MFAACSLCALFVITIVVFPSPRFVLQPYRHCDTVSMSPSVAAPFVQAWLSSGSTFQRAAILFGRYSDEPEVTNIVFE